jgi:hypothetical protein
MIRTAATSRALANKHSQADGQPQRFIAPTPWSAGRPEALVICCSDGRWHRQIQEFVRSQVSDRADLMVLPGGPATLNRWTSSGEEARVAEQALAFLCKHHQLSSAWLIAHQECAYYSTKYGPLDQAYQLRRQMEDLDKGAEVLRRLQPNLAIHLVFASREDGKVIFASR